MGLWEVEISYGMEGSREADTVFLQTRSPEGRKFRSRTELRAYLDKHGLEYRADDFDFSICGRGNNPPSKGGFKGMSSVASSVTTTAGDGEDGQGRREQPPFLKRQRECPHHAKPVSFLASTSSPTGALLDPVTGEFTSPNSGSVPLPPPPPPVLPQGGMDTSSAGSYPPPPHPIPHSMLGPSPMQFLPPGQKNVRPSHPLSPWFPFA